jgi:capsular exopolysaccharide synthesis family protein
MNRSQLPSLYNDGLPAQGYPAYPGSPQVDYNLDQDPGSGGLFNYWQIVRRHKGTIILTALIGMFAGSVFTLFQNPLYQSRTALEIQNSNDGLLNISQSNVMAQSAESTLFDIQTQVKLLQSESLIKSTLAKLTARGLDRSSGMETTGEVFPGSVGIYGRIAAVRRKLNLPEPKRADEFDPLRVAKNLKITNPDQTRFVEVLYDSGDPQLAAEFLNTLTQEFIDSNLEARWNMSQRTGEWLSRQLEEMRGKLERSDEALQSYARRTGLMFASDKTDISEQRLQQLQEELSRAQGDRISKQSRWELTRTSPADALPDIVNDNSVRALQEKITELRRDRAELITTYTEKHSKVVKVDAQIASLEASLQKERAAIIDHLRAEYEGALRRENLLSAEYASQSSLVSEQAEKSIKYNILKREVDSNRQLYDAMLQRVQESNVNSALRSSNVRVVDAAVPPKLPHKPNLPLNLVFGLLSGLSAGIGYVVLRVRADRTLKQPGDGAVFLSLPELGAIPNVSQGTRFLRYASRRRSLQRQTLAALPQSSNSNGGTVRNHGTSASFVDECVELVTWQQKDSLGAESVRAVVTSIVFSGNDPKTLVLTSANPSEGKTTVASNLAIAFADIKRKVLIIDGDFRIPRMHKVFNLSNSRGFTDLLASNNLSSEFLSSLVQKTRVDGLFVLTSGLADQSVSSLLHSTNLGELLAHFRAEFDMIIIDTPPMLRVSDARVFGHYADGVILIMKAGSTTKDNALTISKRFEEDGTKVLGTILNDWKPASVDAYEGYYVDKSKT